MKTKALFHIGKYMALSILSFGLFQHVQAYLGTDSRNGDDHPTKGTIRALVVFAEVTGDPNYNLSTWPWEAGKMPANAGELFDVNLLTFGGGGVVGPAYGPISPTVPVRPTKKNNRLLLRRLVRRSGAVGRLLSGTRADSVQSHRK